MSFSDLQKVKYVNYKPDISVPAPINEVKPSSEEDQLIGPINNNRMSGSLSARD